MADGSNHGFERAIEADVGIMVAKILSQPDAQKDTPLAGATMMGQDSTN